MNNKIYMVENNEVLLKDDLTLAESEKVNLLLGRIYSPLKENEEDPGRIKDIISFLKIVTEPKVNDAVINFSSAKESVVTEIIKDFFLMRINSASNTAEYLKKLAENFLPEAGRTNRNSQAEKD